MMGGYDEEFVSAHLDDRYKCPICHHILRNAVQTNCGHRFCQICFNLSVVTLSSPMEPKKCPMDNTELIDVYGDTAFNREVLSLIVYCRGKHQGCEWAGELRNLQRHLDVCNIYPIPCRNEGCDDRYVRAELDSHLTSCPYRPLDCPFCNVTISARDLSKHIVLACVKFEILCSHCLQVTLPRDDLLRHLAEEGDCPMAPIKCPFRQVGCDTETRRSQMREHLEQNCVDHMLLLLRELTVSTPVNPTIAPCSPNMPASVERHGCSSLNYEPETNVSSRLRVPEF